MTYDNEPKMPGKPEPKGIVIRDGGEAPSKPVIAAFIWGGKVRPVPTLPFGRWKVSTVA